MEATSEASSVNGSLAMLEDAQQAKKPGVPEPFLAEIEPSAYSCPICDESMISLAQLNRHIDDVHLETLVIPSEPSPGKDPVEKVKEKLSHSAENRPHKRILKLDLHEQSSSFSLSENGENNAPVDTAKLSRLHWKRMMPNRANRCSERGCKNTLNVKNGVVNCRKCGNLFCNEHTKLRARLSNAPKDGSSNSPPIVYDPTKGHLAKVCRRCFMDKPGLRAGTKVKSVDLTEDFISKRQKRSEERSLARSTIRTRFIKVADLHSEKYLWETQPGRGVFLVWEKLSRNGPFSKEAVLAAERDIVGSSNWETDEEATHCRLCFVKFSLLIRKHHCRLCGMIVNDGSYNLADPAQFCSAQVPVNLLLRKLPTLNYSPAVRQNWDTLISADADSGYSVRMCKTCKNLLLHTARGESKSDSEEATEVLDAYDQMLAIKATITSSMARYRALIGEKKDSDNHQINRLRVRLRKAVKDLEIMVNTFFNRFFRIDPTLRKLFPIHSHNLVTNIYKASAAYLQETLLELKQLNEAFQSSENQRLAGQLGSAANVEGTPQSVSLLSATVLPAPTSAPRLTKKQIRELREQLMVTNEQKFIIESLIEDLKRRRKFDELVTLEENKKELAQKIGELTEELGEYGF